MKVCPVCASRFEVDTGFCPMDGAVLVDAQQVGLMSTEEAPPEHAASHRGGGPAYQPSNAAPPAAARPPQGQPAYSAQPSAQPTVQSTGQPAVQPTFQSTQQPGVQPTVQATGQPQAGLMASARPVNSAAAGAQALAAVASAYDHAHAQAHAQAPVARSGDDFQGQTLDGRYLIDVRIGIGGMGVVYKATQTTIDKTMAVKILKSAHARDQQIAKRFAQEARLAGKIKHPNVVDIVDFGTAPNGSPYYVMEYLAGHSLAWQIDHKGRLDPPRAYEIAIQVGRALSAAHRESIIHRDLKPDNIFLCPAPAGHGMQDLVKILDFGIARVEGRKTRLTAAGAVVGTPEYMSPEQSQASETDHRTDLYALGIILFEMLVGRVPFQADTMVGTLTKQVFESAPKLHEAEPGLSSLAATDELIGSLLSKMPEDRPQTAVDVIRRLEDAAQRDLGERSPQSHKRATVAIGSWSVADNTAPAPTGVPRSDASPGPLIAPPKNAASFRVSTSSGGPLSVGAAQAKSLEGADVPRRKRPSVIAEGSKLRPPPTAAPRPRGSSTHGSQPAKHRLLPLLLLGTGAAVFAAFMTVGLMRFFSAENGTAAADDATGQPPADAAGAADPKAEASQEADTAGGEAIQPPTSQTPPSTAADPAPAAGTDPPGDASVRGAGTHAPGAADAGDDPKTVASAAKKPVKKKKKKTPTQPVGKPSGDSAGAGHDPPDSGGEPESKVKDPPKPPSVSLGDLKDPFAEK